MAKAKAKARVQRGALSKNTDREEAKGAKGGVKATTEKDWIDQENAELQPMKRSADLVNEAVGRSMYLAPGARVEWRDKKTNRKFTVTRFYLHAPSIAFDKPRTDAEAKMKAAYFEGTDIVYLPVMPMEELTPAKLRAKLVKALAEKKAARKAA